MATSAAELYSMTAATSGRFMPPDLVTTTVSHLIPGRTSSAALHRPFQARSRTHSHAPQPQASSGQDTLPTSSSWLPLTHTTHPIASRRPTHMQVPLTQMGITFCSPKHNLSTHCKQVELLLNMLCTTIRPVPGKQLPHFAARGPPQYTQLLQNCRKGQRMALHSTVRQGKLCTRERGLKQSGSHM